jgi:hypothetical protein
VNGQRGSSRIAISHFPDRYVPNHSAKKSADRNQRVFLTMKIITGGLRRNITILTACGNYILTTSSNVFLPDL